MRKLSSGGRAGICSAHPSTNKPLADAGLRISPNSILEPDRPPFQLEQIARRSDLHRAGFVDVDSELIHSEADMDASELRALYATMAVILRRPKKEQTRVLDALELLVTEEYGGRLRRSFLTALYTARNP